MIFIKLFDDGKCESKILNYSKGFVWLKGKVINVDYFLNFGVKNVLVFVKIFVIISCIS